jgi:hypothetical protein
MAELADAGDQYPEQPGHCDPPGPTSLSGFGLCAQAVPKGLRQVVAGTQQSGNRRFLEIVPAGATQPVQVQLP